MAPLAPGEPPNPDAGADEVAAYFAEDATGIQVGAAFIAASGLLLLWFLATLTAVLRRAEGGPRLSSTAFGAGVITIGLLLADVTAFAVGAFRPENMEASPELAQALMDFSALALGVGSVVRRLLPRGGPALAQDGCTSGVARLDRPGGGIAHRPAAGEHLHHRGRVRPDGVLGFWAGLVAFAAWALAASITLVESLGRADGGGLTGRVRGAVTGAATGAAAGASGRRNT